MNTNTPVSKVLLPSTVINLSHDQDMLEMYIKGVGVYVMSPLTARKLIKLITNELKRWDERNLHQR